MCWVPGLWSLINRSGVSVIDNCTYDNPLNHCRQDKQFVNEVSVKEGSRRVLMDLPRDIGERERERKGKKKEKEGEKNPWHATRQAWLLCTLLVSQLWTNENITKPFNFISLITRDNEVSSNSTETNPLGSYYIEKKRGECQGECNAENTCDYGYGWPMMLCGIVVIQWLALLIVIESKALQSYKSWIC